MSIAVIASNANAASEQVESTDKKPKGFFSRLNPFSKKDKPKKPPKKKKGSTTPTPSPGPAMGDEAGAAPTSTPVPRRTPAPNATIPSAELADYENSSPQIRGIIDNALGLTSLNLDYRYGSADPANGGMDCSGFIYYVLTKCAVPDVPRDARDQYVWVRKAGNFQAVIAQSDDSFELNALRPGDLLFWGDTSSANRDPAITETMIYLGREKSTGQRIMVGASETRTYKNQLRSGVSVIDFKVASPEQKSEDRPDFMFVGYGRVPGLMEP